MKWPWSTNSNSDENGSEKQESTEKTSNKSNYTFSSTVRRCADDP